MRSKDGQVFFFHDWDSVLNHAKTVGVSEEGISNDQFMHDLEEIRSVAHKTFFQNRDGEEIHNLINQIHFFKPDAEHGYAFVSHVHSLADLIRKAKKIKGFEKLKAAGLFTHDGMLDQFFLSMWFAEHELVEEFEPSKKPVDSDLLIDVGTENKINIQIKDIKEEAKRDRVQNAIFEMDHFLNDRSRAMRLDKHLRVKSFVGVPLAGIPEGYWLNLIQERGFRVQRITHVIPPGKFGNKRRIVYRIRIGWSEWNYQGIAPYATFNNSQKFISELEGYASKVKKGGLDDCRVLLVSTWDEYDLKWMREAVNETGVGIMLANRFGYHILGASIVLPKQFNTEENLLAEKLPVRYDFD